MEGGVQRFQSLNYYEMVRKGGLSGIRGKNLTPTVDARGSKYIENEGSPQTPGCILCTLTWLSSARCGFSVFIYNTLHLRKYEIRISDSRDFCCVLLLLMESMALGRLGENFPTELYPQPSSLTHP